MRILSSLTYYLPHISGLTIYARRLVNGLAAKGHSVTIVTSKHDSRLAGEEFIDGARVLRTRGLFKLSKGIFMPFYPLRLARELHRHDVLLLHLPQLEAAFAAVYARLIARRPVVTIVHCDIELPRGLIQIVFMPLIRLSHLVTGVFSNVLVVNSGDYLESSRYLQRFRAKVRVSPPPCALARPSSLDDVWGLGDAPAVGFVGRFAEEKGIAYLLDAIPDVLSMRPDVRFVFVGESQQVLGENTFATIKEQLRRLGDHAVLTGIVPEGQLAALFERFDVVVLPSINSTESFGMVQVEAMLAGTPVVASDIAGVREPVNATGMGEVVASKDPPALAAAILRVLEGGKARYARPREEIEALFGVDRSVKVFERLLESLVPAVAVAGEPAAAESRSGR